MNDDQCEAIDNEWVNIYHSLNKVHHPRQFRSFTSFIHSINSFLTEMKNEEWTCFSYLLVDDNELVSIIVQLMTMNLFQLLFTCTWWMNDDHPKIICSCEWWSFNICHSLTEQSSSSSSISFIHFVHSLN